MKLHKIQCLGELKNPLYYCRDTGDLYRLQTSSGTFKGLNKIKTDDGRGYLRTSVDGKDIRVHQIIAMEFLGHKPDGTLKVVVDHVNGDKLNNRIENLQLTTNRINIVKGKLHTNKTSNLPLNVHWNKKVQKYVVQFMFNGKLISFGYYQTLESAISARNEVQTRLVENNEPLEQFKSELITARRFKQ